MEPTDIIMIYGTDAFEMTSALLKYSDISTLVPKTASIVLKPNLVVAASPEEGATTHPEIVEAIIVYLRNNGYEDISIVESSWIGDSTDRAFKVHGYHKFVKKYGVTLVDVKRDRYETITAHGYTIEMSKTIMESDYLINLPVLKGHCQTTITCALKNMKGCISDRSKRQFHTWGLHTPIAVLNTIRKPDITIVDSIQGDLDFEEGGNPVQTNRMFAGCDPVLVDTFGASLMGFEVHQIPYLQQAELYGVGTTDLSQVQYKALNKDLTGEEYRPSGRVQELATYIRPSSACSACYGNLIHALARLDEQGLLDKLHRKIYIGQGYKEKTSTELGVGICTNKFSHSLPGCPPKALDMLQFMKEHLKD
ncbi:MAG: DUF362 domain-containing protein [Sphaerochaetaceae bacterium]|jgi:uncharacterized protein (DUF362 family)|nr:DUF362 domain-containing protein [Sphaerochaetaceae bacterium]MDY0372190.1 DUF362 domain-containing protein [Sphaerochaetaceae bacterium]